MRWYYEEVPGLGPVVVSRHAQAKMAEDGVPEEVFREALFDMLSEAREGFDVVRREARGVRVIIEMEPDGRPPTIAGGRRCRLVKTVYRVENTWIDPRRVV
jgi:hypothetical protein